MLKYNRDEQYLQAIILFRKLGDFTSWIDLKKAFLYLSVYKLEG